MPFLMRRLAPWLAALALLFTALASSAQEESDVRAAMIFNLLKFTTWPDSVATTAPLRICLIETSQELSTALRRLDGRKIDNHTLNVALNQIAGNVVECNVLITDASGKGYDPAKLARHGLLLIGENHFVDRGGMIGIVNIDNKIRFEINASEMQRAGIGLSAKVLQLAIRVR